MSFLDLRPGKTFPKAKGHAPVRTRTGVTQQERQRDQKIRVEDALKTGSTEALVAPVHGFIITYKQDHISFGNGIAKTTISIVTLGCSLLY